MMPAPEADTGPTSMQQSSGAVLACGAVAQCVSTPGRNYRPPGRNSATVLEVVGTNLSEGMVRILVMTVNGCSPGRLNLMIRYSGGSIVDGVVLARGRDRLRVAVAGFPETIELRRIGAVVVYR